jgi:hypothetical protein
LTGSGRPNWSNAQKLSCWQRTLCFPPALHSNAWWRR